MPKGTRRTTGLTVDLYGGKREEFYARNMDRGERGARRTTEGGARVAVGDKKLAEARAIARRNPSSTGTVETRRDTGKKGKGRK